MCGEDRWQSQKGMNKSSHLNFIEAKVEDTTNLIEKALSTQYETEDEIIAR